MNCGSIWDRNATGICHIVLQPGLYPVSATFLQITFVTSVQVAVKNSNLRTRKV